MNDWLHDAIDYYFEGAEPEDLELPDDDKVVLIWEYIKFEKAKAKTKAKTKTQRGLSMFNCP